MRSVVRDHFVAFTEPLEGRVNHFYADVKGLVTIAIGNLVDPFVMASKLPLYRTDGALASPDEIRADWDAVKTNPNAAKLGHRFAAKLTKLRMRDADVAALVLRKLDQNDVLLRQRFPEFEEWPADAQLATHSMAWALGPHFNFPKTVAALKNQDFLTAAVECKMRESDNPGVKPRNIANRMMYRSAATVVTHKLDRDVLHWPHEAKVVVCC